MSSNTEQNRQCPHQDTLATYLHDFEPTIQGYIKTPAQLRGILNFSALWHEVVYLNDTAIGDNPHLIYSFIASPDTGLYFTVREFIKAGILQPLFRKKVAIRESVLVESHPTLSDIYAGWRLRDKNSPDKFLSKEFGSQRDRYNRTVDQLLFRDTSNSVIWYDPDDVKPLFRDRIRQQLNRNSELLQLIEKVLPIEGQRKYQNICNNDPYFTNADLWNLVRDIESAKDLIIAQGHINQQCYADSILAGMTGSDLSNTQLAKFNWNMNVGSTYEVPVNPPASLDEVFEQAAVILQAPTIELLGLLTPEQVLQLREEAKKTIFKVARSEAGQISLEKFRKIYLNAIIKYWNYVCEFLEKEYPKYVEKKRRLGIFSCEALPSIPPEIRKFAIYITIASTAVNYFIPYVEPIKTVLTVATLIGSQYIANRIYSALRYHVLFEDTPAMKEMREKLPPQVWRVRGAWSTNKWRSEKEAKQS